ncbi:MAG TPA: hypothetical protein VGW38_07320 [Chloroflexota bacterium]|nr:hypothetical protein [Chloroflexota bacterium]
MVQLRSKQLLALAVSAAIGVSTVATPSMALADIFETAPAATAVAVEPWNDPSLSYGERRRAAMEAGVFVETGQVSLAALTRTDSMQGLRADPSAPPPIPAPPPHIETPPTGLQLGSPPFAAAGLLGGIGLAFTVLMAMLPRPKTHWGS